MRAVRVSENFIHVSEFKAQAADWLRKLAETDAPVVVTQKGKPAGVLLSPRAFDELTEQARFVSAATEGLADAEAGRVRPHADAVPRMKARFGGIQGGAGSEQGARLAEAAEEAAPHSPFIGDLLDRPRAHGPRGHRRLHRKGQPGCCGALGDEARRRRGASSNSSALRAARPRVGP